MIKGVGPVTVKRIVKHFGLDTLEIIENQLDRLSEVPGIAKKRIAMIQRTWAEQKSIKEVMIFLQGHGVSTTYAVKIYKQYGENSIATVKTNPYQLAIDIFGIGFLTADKIARSDRVMQLKNDYNKEVFNGDLGIVRAIDHIEKEVTIDFDGRDVAYDYADLNELTLAWASSIHKSQGSEYPVVILPLYTQHYIMLSRNLFYTGITRAKKLALLVGSEKAIAIAVKQVKQQERYTRLKEMLQSRKS